jgi:hypothetical protein
MSTLTYYWSTLYRRHIGRKSMHRHCTRFLYNILLFHVKMTCPQFQMAFTCRLNQLQSPCEKIPNNWNASVSVCIRVSTISYRARRQSQKLQNKTEIKMAVFYVVAPCRLAWVYQRFRGSYRLHHQAVTIAWCPDDGGGTDLRNVGKLTPVCTALQPVRQTSSWSPPWEPQVILSWK